MLEQHHANKGLYCTLLHVLKMKCIHFTNAEKNLHKFQQKIYWTCNDMKK